MTLRQTPALFLMVFTNIFAHAQEVVPLPRELSRTADSISIDLLYELSNSLSERNPEVSKQYAYTAYRLAHQLCDEYRITRTGLALGKAYRRKIRRLNTRVAAHSCQSMKTVRHGRY